jgi:hypothetical protein
MSNHNVARRLHALLVANPNGLTAEEITQTLGVTYQKFQSALHLLRRALGMSNNSANMIPCDRATNVYFLAQNENDVVDYALIETEYALTRMETLRHGLRGANVKYPNVIEIQNALTAVADLEAALNALAVVLSGGGLPPATPTS